MMVFVHFFSPDQSINQLTKLIDQCLDCSWSRWKTDENEQSILLEVPDDALRAILFLLAIFFRVFKFV